MMTWKKWTAIGGSIVMVLTGTAAATGAIETLTEKINRLNRLASIDYVDAEFMRLAAEFAPMAERLKVLSGVVADQAVRGLEAELAALNQKAVEKQAMIELLPANLTLRVELRAINDAIASTSKALEGARCARIELITGQSSPNCSSRF